MPILVDLNPSLDCIRLIDTECSIVNDRRARFQLDQQFNVLDEGGDTEIVLGIVGSRQEVIQNLIELFEFLDVSYELSGRTSRVIEGFLEERRLFELFSNEAKAIWRGDIKAPIFAEFTQLLARCWPNRTLYAKQLLAALHLAFSQHACNFSVPGSGKTAIVFASYTYLKSLEVSDSKNVNRMLVIGPLSCFRPWEDEFENCFGRRAESFRISGDTPARDINGFLHGLDEKNASKDLILVSYQSLANYLDGIKILLSRQSNRFMVVLDEAHRAKNTEGGLWAQSVLALAPHAKSRVVLTGTPAPNGFQDLYNLFEFIWPNRRVIGYEAAHLRAMTKQIYDDRREKVVDNISPFFVRITKRDLGIPDPVNCEPYQVKMDPIQDYIYRYIENLYISYFERDSKNVSNSIVRSRLIRLMQAASNPMLLRKPIRESLDSDLSDTLFIDDTDFLDTINQYENLETPVKFRALLSMVVRLLEQGQKVLVWTYYIGNILGIAEYLSTHSIQSKLLYGAIPTASDEADVESRENIIDEFKSKESSFQVLIANPYAVGESISLHRACQNAIYFERNFNAAVFLQSQDRIHRFGMEEGKTATYRYIQCADTIEQTIARRLDEKIDLMMDVIESQEIPLLNLTRESEDTDQDDILAIIKDYMTR